MGISTPEKDSVNRRRLLPSNAEVKRDESMLGWELDLNCDGAITAVKSPHEILPWKDWGGRIGTSE